MLENLLKLPPRCAAVVDGKAVFILRGVPGTTPAFIPTDHVGTWNQSHGVTEAQQRAMIAGATLGWHLPGADVDQQEPEDRGPFTYTYATDITVSVTVTAPTEEAAAREARKFLDGLTFPVEVAITNTLDLIETDDLRC